MKCPGCGTDNAENGVYCGRCGTQLREFTSAPDPEDNIVTPIPEELGRMMTGDHLKWPTVIFGIAAIMSAVQYFAGDQRVTDLLGMVGGVAMVTAFIVLKTWGRGSTVRSMEYMRSHLVPGTGDTPTGQSSRVRAARLPVLVGFAMGTSLSCAFFGLAIHLEPRADNPVWVVALVMGVAIAAIIPWTIFRNPMYVRLTKDGIGQDIAMFGATLWFTRKDIDRVEVRGRILSIYTKNAPFGQRRPTYLLLCGRDQLGEVDQWAGVFGADVSK